MLAAKTEAAGPSVVKVIQGTDSNTTNNKNGQRKKSLADGRAT